MESIETEVAEQDYDGLGTRELRRKFAKEQYENSKHAAEIRSLGQATAIRKVPNHQFFPLPQLPSLDSTR